MRTISSLFLLFVLYNVSLFAQTEVWRTYEPFSSFKPDGKGNVYLFIYSDSTADTIKKINSAGEAEWRRTYKGTPIYDTNGTYIGTYLITNGSISRLDTSENYLWTVTSPSITSTFAIDDSNNLILGNSASSYDGDTWTIIYRIMKLSSNGNVSFQVPFELNIKGNGIDEFGVGLGKPLYIISNFRQQIFVLMSIRVFTRKNGNSSDKTKWYLARIDGKTGNVIKLPKSTKYIFPTGISYSIKETNVSSIGSGFIMSSPELNDRLLIPGIINGQIRKINYVKYPTEWGFFSIDSLGKTTKFKFKGKGVLKQISDGFTQEFSIGNNISDMLSNNDGSVLLAGTVNQNKVTHWSEAKLSGWLMKYNYITKKIFWKNSIDSNIIPNWNDKYNPPPQPYYFFLSTNYNGQTFLRYTRSHKQLYVYNETGSKSYLSFTDTIILMQKNSFLDDGYIYLTMKGDSGTYLAKYSLPTFKFASDFTNQTQQEQFALQQNYPNPFNPKTVIRYQLPNSGFVTMKIYNVIGQEVATLLNKEETEEGEHEIEFDASNLSSGVYFYRLSVGSLSGQVVEEGKNVFTETKKFLLMK
jgi:hypothetical protein